MTLQLDNPAVIFLIFAGFSIWTGFCWSIGEKEENDPIHCLVIIPLIAGIIGTIISLGDLIVHSL